MKRSAWIGLSALMMLSTGCLPGDTRPEPGREFVTAEPTAASVEGFTTDDGWTIHFERILTSLGQISLHGKSCTSYADTTYDRLFDFTVAGEQKVGEVYGLGTCDLAFQWSGPSGDTKLQNGVSPSELEFIWSYMPLVVLMHVRGTAERGAEKKRFTWVFSDHQVLGDCRTEPMAEPFTTMTLSGGDDFRHRIEFHAENLFRVIDSDLGHFQFAEFAAADTDEDDNITLDEVLRHVVGTSMVKQSLYFILLDHNLPNLITFDGGSCTDVTKWTYPD